MVLCGSKYLEYNSRIRTENDTLNKRIIELRIIRKSRANKTEQHQITERLINWWTKAGKLVMNTFNWCTEHKQICRLNVDCPMFARVKYLVIMKLIISTLFAQVFVMRHQMSCCGFFFFSSGLTCGLLKSHRTPHAALLLHTILPSAVPVEFHNYNDIFTRVARRLPVLLCAQGTFCFKPRGVILVESTQIRWFSRWSSGGSWSGRAVAQRRPWVLKLGLKRLSDYYSSEIAV